MAYFSGHMHFKANLMFLKWVIVKKSQIEYFNIFNGANIIFMEVSWSFNFLILVNTCM